AYAGLLERVDVRLEHRHRRREEGREADDVRLVLVDLLHEHLRRDVDTEVVHREARALEHDVDEVLADVVHVALDRAHDIGADLLRSGLRQQRAKDVERALHRARRDQHLRHEEVAALEPCTDLLEGRDQRVVEHLFGIEVLLEALVRQVLHLGRVADERVVVQPFEDLLFGHAAPRWSRWPSRSARTCASSMRSGASWAMRSEVKRAVGPEIESAAIASPAGPSTGAESAVSPTSSSSIDVA